MVHIYLARLSWWQDDAYFVKLLNIDILLNIFSCVLFWSTYLIWLICEIFLAVTSFQRWFLIFLKCFRLWPLLIIEYQILFETYLLWTHVINVQKNIFVKYFCLWRRGAAYGFIHSLGMKIDGGPTLHWTKQYLLNVIREPFKNYLAENHFAKQP